MVVRVPPAYPDLGAGQSAWGISPWLLLAKCKEVHRRQVLQLDGEEEGREGRGEERGGAESQELARSHGKNWICFHSSSNKQ